jgi:putative CocE/NonD family hydrolase
VEVKTKFPRPVRQIENTWIPMSDGTKLAARIWLPEDAEENPVPAILEYIPYRKDDFTAEEDAMMHPYFAGHGYASIRVDMRGSGDADGILLDNYLPQEQDDGLEVLEWIAAQPWCTGSVGMIGISWGGFSGLQVAARAPSQLKAIVTICSTVDRYGDDLTFNGGCLNASDTIAWSGVSHSWIVMPPDPAVVGERWREMWLERLEQTPPWVGTWLEHQRKDDYWRHGSVAEDYSAIKCAVYAVGGWRDGYTNSILRMLEGLPGPKKGLIGPWAHMNPHHGAPEPAMGFLHECLRWWDYWLKGIDTGIMDEPMLRAWIEGSMEPSALPLVSPGRWVAEGAWPAPDITTQSYALNPGTLDEKAGREEKLDLRGSAAAGMHSGRWCPFGLAGDTPPDQRQEDGLCLTCDSPPVDEPLEFLGFPVVTVKVSADRPQALLAVRLCDVSPEGISSRISWGLLNLTHRESHEEPTPLQPGKQYTVTVRLNAMGHRLEAGHRWRLTLSSTYWPQAWPSPEPVTLSVFTGGVSRLEMPLRPPRVEDADLKPFEPPEVAPPMEVEVLRTASADRFVTNDVVKGLHELSVVWDTGLRRLVSSGIEYGWDHTETYRLIEGDPLSASAQCSRVMGVARGDWRPRVEMTHTLTADKDAFLASVVLDAYEADSRVFNKTWTFRFPRDLV